MTDLKIELKKDKKVFFASDFHLGLPGTSRKQEIIREKRIVEWLCAIQPNAQALLLVGDIFDFWFEYKHAVPRGYIRFLGKISEFIDSGIPVYFFTGNHDLWMFSYFQEELKARVFTHPIHIKIDDKNILVGHGDGLGPGDDMFKLLKRVFTNGFARWVFKWIHPDIGIGFARRWSKASRIRKKGMDEVFLGEEEYLIKYCREIESRSHHDYYVFGHRHLAVEYDLSKKSKYINLGDWIKTYTFGVFDEHGFQLKELQA